jgi:hypothetical protein
MRTLATHVIWTAYMTWPPGDPRGHWSPLYDFYGRLMERGGQLNMPDPVTKRVAVERAKEPPMILGDDEIASVAASIGGLVHGNCDRTPGEIPKPATFAAAVERTHVHLLFGPMYEEIGRCVGRIKGTSSSVVLGLPPHQGRSRVWTAGYWKVFLYDQLAVETVKQYIDAHNLRRGLDADPFPWISPVFI